MIKIKCNIVCIKIALVVFSILRIVAICCLSGFLIFCLNSLNSNDKDTIGL